MKPILKRMDRWTLRKEEKSRVQSLRDMPLDDQERTATLDTIERTSKLRLAKAETRTKVITGVASVAILAFAAYMGYKVDSSDDIPRNRCSNGLFQRFFRV